MSKEQKIDLSKMNEFQREVYKLTGIVPAFMDVVNNKTNISDEELFQEEIRMRQQIQDPLDEITEESLKRKVSDLLFKKTFKDMIVALKEKENINNMSEKEEKEIFIENCQNIREQIVFLKNKEIENIKTDPEKSLKNIYKINLDMKKRIARQSLKIRFLEKEAQELADRLATELNKNILDRIKESILNILKSLKKR